MAWILMCAIIATINWNVVLITLTCVAIAGSYAVTVRTTVIVGAWVSITILCTCTVDHGITSNTTTGVTFTLVRACRVLTTCISTTIAAWIIIAC